MLFSGGSSIEVNLVPSKMSMVAVVAIATRLSGSAVTARMRLSASPSRIPRRVNEDDLMLAPAHIYDSTESRANIIYGMRFLCNQSESDLPYAKKFNANYGGIPKNVWLHVADKVYQTLPLYSNLGTTGVYIYATDIEVESRRAVINAESEVRNESKRPVSVGYKVEVIDPDGKTVGSFSSNPVTIAPGATTTVAASDTISDLHFWSWGYGYLYDVKTILTVDGKDADEVVTRTGFRKTRFGEHHRTGRESNR